MNVLCVLCGGGYSCISLCNPVLKIDNKVWILNLEWWDPAGSEQTALQLSGEKSSLRWFSILSDVYIYIYIWKASLCLCWTKMCCICAAANLCFTSAEWSGYSFLLSTSSRGWFDFPGMKHLIERNKIEVNLTIKQHGQAATAVSDCNNDWDQHLKNKDWN